MKFSKTALLALSGVFLIAGLGFMLVSAVDLGLDPSNAVQHIEKVKFIASPINGTATLQQVGNRLVGIITNDNFTLSREDEGLLNVNDGNIGSSILGGVKNQLEGSYNVILGGWENGVDGMYNVVLGGYSNTIEGGKTSSAILGGNENRITSSQSSVIVGSNNVIEGVEGGNPNDGYSVVVGTNSSVIGNNSASLGVSSNVAADNSFLWTDVSHNNYMSTNDAFAVVGNNGMVIGTNKAHSFAQLTLDGGLVISESTTSDPLCGGGNGGGTMKVKAQGSKICLCSCDGNGWSSMFGLGECRSICDSNYNKPVCKNTVIKMCDNDKVVYSGSCEEGKGEVLEGEGAYFVDKHNIVHWSCQTDNGEVANCSGEAQGAGCEPVYGSCSPTHYECIAGTPSDESYSEDYHRWTWNCKGSYGGTSISCVENEVINGACAGTHGSSVGCVAGEYIDESYDAVAHKWTWKCAGINEGSVAECSEYVLADGQCGTPQYNCVVGASTNNNYDATTHKRTWTCEGVNGGNPASCVRDEVKDGVCSNPQKHFECLVGNPINTGYNSLNHKWTWKCEGINGGNAVNCSENDVKDGQCGTGTFECIVGDSIDNYTGSTQWTWRCTGINGGNTKSCTKNMVINGKCSDTHFGCQKGTSSYQNTGDTQWTWKCLGINGGTTDNCSENIPPVPVPINGECSPGHYECVKGTPFDKSEYTTGYLWKCAGINGGLTGECKEYKEPKCGVVVDTCNPGTYGYLADTATQDKWKCTNGTGSINCAKDKTPQCGTGINTCTLGTPEDKPDSTTQYIWNCKNGSATPVNCIKDKESKCATGHYYCDLGTSSNNSHDTVNHKYTWTCKNGEAAPKNCSENESVNGQCSSTHYNCTSGTPGSAIFNESINKWTWNCVGANGGTTANCSEDGPECSSTHFGCVKGNSISQRTGYAQWTWNCNVPGKTVLCSENMVINGECGGTHFECLKGTPGSQNTGDTQWTWQCGGINGGTIANCSENIPPVPVPINGECSSTHYGCNKGNLIVGSKKETTDKYTWTCEGLYGGSSRDCTEYKEPKCGETLNECSAGTMNDISDTTTQYRWQCSNGTYSSVTCTKDKAPQCGNGVDTCNPGTYGYLADTLTQDRWRCTNGTATPVDCAKDKASKCASNHYYCDLGNSSDNNYDAANHKYTWICTNGTAAPDNCVEIEDVASCGPLAGGEYSVAPSGDGLCGDGSTYSTVTTTPNEYTWTCTKGSSTVSCDASRKRALCGPAAGQGASVPPSGITNLCKDSTHTASAVTTGDVYYEWTCTLGDDTVSCKATRLLASCGSADGSPASCEPSSNLCISSTPSAVSTVGNKYTWTCTKGASVVSCEAPKLGAACGTANNGSYSTKPTTNLCKNGAIASDVTPGDNTYTWNCVLGCDEKSCSATRLRAKCGTANNGSYASKPTTNLCGSGSSSTVEENDTTYTWTCTLGDDTANCSATRLKSECGSATQTSYSCAPTTNLCNGGSTASNMATGDNNYTWKCTKGSSVVNCSTTRLRAACGNADGTSVSQKPTNITDLCKNSSHTASAVATGVNNYTWTCRLGCDEVSCSATRDKPSCGSAANGTYETAPTTNLCANSTSHTDPILISNTQEYSWDCKKGATTVNCKADRVACGTATAGGPYISAPTSNLCNGGSSASSMTTLDTTYTWKCTKNSVTANCSANRKVNGKCDTTAINACEVGLLENDNYDEPNNIYTWECKGINGGTTDDCMKQGSSNGKCGDDIGGCEVGVTKNLKGPENHEYTWECEGINGGSTARGCYACERGYTDDGIACVGLEPIVLDEPECGLSFGMCIKGTAINKNSADQTWQCKYGLKKIDCNCKGEPYTKYSCPLGYRLGTDSNGQKKCYLNYKVCATPQLIGINVSTSCSLGETCSDPRGEGCGYLDCLPSSKSCWGDTSLGLWEYNNGYTIYPDFIDQIRLVGFKNLAKGDGNVFAIGPYGGGFDDYADNGCAGPTTTNVNFLTDCGGLLNRNSSNGSYDRGYYINSCSKHPEWNERNPCWETMDNKCKVIGGGGGGGGGGVSAGCSCSAGSCVKYGTNTKCTRKDAGGGKYDCIADYGTSVYGCSGNGSSGTSPSGTSPSGSASNYCSASKGMGAVYCQNEYETEWQCDCRAQGNPYNGLGCTPYLYFGTENRFELDEHDCCDCM